MIRLTVFLLLLMVHNSIIAQNRNPFTEKKNLSIIIEDFEAEQPGTLPKSWYNMKGDGQPHTYTGQNREHYQYEVVQEYGNKFLRYAGTEAKHLNYPLVDKAGLNIYDTPVLQWKWRIHEIPEGANEDTGKNDVAASIYVVFGMGRVALFKKVPKSIRYTWSSTLPVGTELSKLYGNQRIVVVGSGKEEAGRWKTFQRNIVEDYRRFYEDNPPKVPMAILILSDANDTGNFTKADYDEIKLLPEN